MSSYRDELLELLAVEGPDADQLLRIAELTEYMYDAEASLPWWQKAALAGSQDAIDALEVFDDTSGISLEQIRQDLLDLLRRRNRKDSKD